MRATADDATCRAALTRASIKGVETRCATALREHHVVQPAARQILDSYVAAPLHADHFHLQNTGWGTCR